ncbi:ABC transporter ATP-binding protein/permease [Rhizobium sp. LC145]|uniref:ABC transporter ATP-binding protein/permease n=1 Tax=Rhizobium sp. LC145 TaxID=1120688 RepID=UPI000629EDE4|nr:ABC transporter ATP-binding protein/permease [Rhizobium sp. LC145]KKX30717.1 glycosyl transferase family 1 [Rhizobium sp. LC145]TKT68424.1 ABC transporter ATP-binding protein/permease [Rhizobiaceae bacterium LC148]
MADLAEGEVRPFLEGQEYELGFYDQLRLMSRAFWASPVRNRVVVLAFGLLAIILLTTYAQYRLNQWNVPFYNALERRDLTSFIEQLKVFAVIGGSLLVLNVVQAWLNQMAALYMREGLSRDLVNQWLKPRRALQLAQVGVIGVNPDQRLHEDARNLSEITTTLAIGLVSSTILLVSFIGVLWAVSANFSFSFSGREIVIPGYMVWAALLYAGSASMLSNLVGGGLPILNSERYSKEAELRFALMHANENLTAITLANGEESERRRIQLSISTVLGVIRRLVTAYTNLTWVSAGFGWLSTIAPILIAAPVYFSGNLSFGGLMMAVGAFNQVNAALRWYVDNFRQIADWKAALMRVSTFRNALGMIEIAPPRSEIRCLESSDGTMRIRHLEVFSGPEEQYGLRLPDEEVVIRQGERLMINGDPGADRRMLFQALAGIWHWGHGEVVLPTKDRMLFMPQKGYLPAVTLREVLTYPANPADYDDESLMLALNDAGLVRMTRLLDSADRWDRVLDEDDQVRLRIANALILAPRWLIIENALEGLDRETQETLARLLAGMRETTIVYIGRSDVYHEILSPRQIHLEVIAGGQANGSK